MDASKKDYESNVVPIEKGLGPDGIRGIGKTKGLSGGGGDMTDLTARVAKLEAHVEHMRSDVGEMKPSVNDIRERLRGLEVKVDHLPGKGFVVTVALSFMAFFGLMTAFQAQIQSYFGLTSVLP